MTCSIATRCTSQKCVLEIDPKLCANANYFGVLKVGRGLFTVNADAGVPDVAPKQDPK